MARIESTSASEPVVRVNELSKTYGRVRALSNVNFSIYSGEVLGLIGPNGAGKTTLFECLAGIQPSDRGEIVFSTGHAGAARRSKVLFYVPDSIAPWPDQPVNWALEFSVGFFGGRRDLFEGLVRDLGLSPLLRARIGALSKGQRKRVLLAIGLLMPQPVLMIDEPFDGLDLRQSREVATVLRRHLSGGRTMFLSIHQIADAAKICDRFVLLSGGQVVAEGVLDELTALASKRLGHAPPADFEEVFLALA
jgi:ABC-2 type transport system ATP-binding protein